MTADLLGTVQFACLALGALLALATVLVAWQQALAHQRLTGRTHFGVTGTTETSMPTTAGADLANPRQTVMRFRPPRTLAASRPVLCPATGVR